MTKVTKKQFRKLELYRFYITMNLERVRHYTSINEHKKAIDNAGAAAFYINKLSIYSFAKEWSTKDVLVIVGEGKTRELIDWCVEMIHHRIAKGITEGKINELHGADKII